MKVGSYNHLNIVHTTSEGLILSDGEQEAFLPKTQAPADPDASEPLLVFIYHSKDGRLFATTKHPYACVGDFAYLKVVDKTDAGAYLDFGIDKDLFVPVKQSYNLEIGESYVVYLYLDDISEKIAATTRLEDYVVMDFSNLEEGDEVSLLIFDSSDLGYSAIIDNRYMGLLYRDEVYESLEIGDTRTGYIKKIRFDSEKIDLSLRRPGFDYILESKDVLLNLLKQNDGVIHLGDKSSPDDIRDRLKMSKKAFKQVIGGLYKERRITVGDYQITLTPEKQEPELGN